MLIIEMELDFLIGDCSDLFGFFWFFSPLPGKMISMSAASGVAEVTPESSWKRRIAVVVDCCSEKLREE